MPPISPSEHSPSSLWAYGPLIPLLAIIITLTTLTFIFRQRAESVEDVSCSPALVAEKRPLTTSISAVPPPYTPYCYPPEPSNVTPNFQLSSGMSSEHLFSKPLLSNSALLALPSPTIRWHPYPDEHVQPADYEHGDYQSSLPCTPPPPRPSSASSGSSLASTPDFTENKLKEKGAIKFGRRERIWTGTTSQGVVLCRRDNWMHGVGWGRHVRVIEGGSGRDESRNLLLHA